MLPISIDTFAMKKTGFLLLLFLGIVACTDDEESNITLPDTFDRTAMLTHWADNFIVLGYEAYQTSLENLSTASSAFINETNTAHLQQLKQAWLNAYIAWQRVSMFEIGKAEALTLRDFTNIYPTNATKIEENILSGSYNFMLPSTRDQQGFPAIDYLLHGTGSTEAEVAATFAQSEGHRQYLQALVSRLVELNQEVLNDWKGGFRESFIANNGSEASSSVNKMVNDYMFYYEKALRAGKIGIPAGVFSNQPLSDRVEAFYRKDVSKTLFMEALQATSNFFSGTSANGNGPSLAAYLDFVNAITEGEPLRASIEGQFQEAMTVGNQLSENFFQEVETNNNAMLATYDALQKNVVLLKVDMFQALNIRVDYVDADGD